MDDMEDDSTFYYYYINGADEGSYIHDIHVNPENGNELLVVLSNYKVESLFHSSNGGDTWSAVGGNLRVKTDHPFSVRPSPQPMVEVRIIMQVQALAYS